MAKKTRYYLRIIGPITLEKSEEFLEALDELNHNTRGKKILRIYINSTGGNTDAAFAIYDALKTCEMDTETVAEGFVASAGVIIYLAGKRRFITKHSSIAIHKPQLAFDEEVVQKDDCLRFARRLEWFEEIGNKMIRKETGKGRKKVARDMRKSRIFNAKKAVKYGLAQKII